MVVPRQPVPTVSFVDEYCQAYQHLFPEVRSFENFKYLIIGMISDIKRKSLRGIAKVVGLKNEQSLHHFLTVSPWDVKVCQQLRLSLILERIAGKKVKLIIDETGDKKRGHSTDYVARQYIGNLGKVESGIVSVNAYCVVEDTLFPLIFKVFKPQSTLLPEDTYKTKPQLAMEIILELEEMGFKIEQVLADSLYGESSTFIQGLNKLHLKYVVAIRSNHKAWLNQEEVTYSDWQTFDRVFSNGKEQTRFIQEIICPDSGEARYWKITSDFCREQKTNTWYLMSNGSGDLYSTIGNEYGFRNWIEYGFKQSKNELGWADFRVTSYEQISKWWEIVNCAFLLISLQANQRNNQVIQENVPEESQSLNCLGTQGLSQEPLKYSEHKWWNFSGGWKSTLNNLRLIIQPYVFYNFLKPWLLIFDIPCLKAGFIELLNIMNKFPGYITLDSG